MLLNSFVAPMLATLSVSQTEPPPNPIVISILFSRKILDTFITSLRGECAFSPSQMKTVWCLRIFFICLMVAESAKEVLVATSILRFFFP